MIYSFDAGPLIALLNSEPGASVSAQLLAGNPGDCWVHAVNLAEVYYIFYRRGGVTAAAKALSDLQSVGLRVQEDMDAAFWMEAASYKGRHAMALPDGFCIALARRLGGTVVTTDRAEFGPLQPLGHAPILFIR